MVSPNPLVSVLMPAYNVEKFVAEAVESILQQTFEEFELNIIDDGSTDGTLSILERYAQRDRRIRLVSRPNQGVVRTRNELLDMSRGELIAKMDSDDISTPDRFQLQVQYLQDHPSCVA